MTTHDADYTDADLAEDVALLNGKGLRVHPTRGVIHTASCPTQNPIWHPEMLPWPKYANTDDRACKTCKPNLDLPTPPATEETR